MSLAAASPSKKQCKIQDKLNLLRRYKQIQNKNMKQAMRQHEEQQMLRDQMLQNVSSYRDRKNANRTQMGSWVGSNNSFIAHVDEHNF